MIDVIPSPPPPEVGQLTVHSITADVAALRQMLERVPALTSMLLMTGQVEPEGNLRDTLAVVAEAIELIAESIVGRARG